VTSFRASLPRAWWSHDLPRVRPHPARYATYSRFDYDLLPPVPGWADDGLGWLKAAPLHADSALAARCEWARRDIADLRPAESIRLPESFLQLASEAGPRQHLRSVTGCYFDLGDHVLEVPGGELLHFLSDSQWTRHWLLYTGTGGTAVVTTDVPAGFVLDPADNEAYGTGAGYELCADGFAEFVWRFWTENELWLALQHGSLPAAGALRDYAAHYANTAAAG
jgi:hypothetical protein